jgi:hypothetical protein
VTPAERRERVARPPGNLETTMTRNLLRIVPAAMAALAVACSDGAGPSSGELDETLSPAFSTIPIGFGNTLNTFGAEEGEWAPGDRDTLRTSTGFDMGFGGSPEGRGRERYRHQHRDMMCGGLGGPFMGGFGPHWAWGFGLGPFEHGALPGHCAFDASTGRVECDTVERAGLTVARSVAYADADGNVQEAFDRVTTDLVNVRIAVWGTRTRRDGATSTVEHESDRTVAGLSEGSTERTVAGTSAGSETTTGADDTGAFTAVRVIGDTVSGIVIPADQRFPSAGTVIRSMTATVTYEGQPPVVSTWREVITYDGSDTATVVITRNGETVTCTLPLPGGPLTCS